MALRAGYYGIKNALLKKLEGLTNALVIKSLGEGLELSAVGKLSLTSGTLNYSTIEQNTGIKWVDGSDIYVITKVFDDPITLSANSWVTIESTSDVKEVIESTVRGVNNEQAIGYSGVYVTPAGAIQVIQTRSQNIKASSVTYYYTKKPETRKTTTRKTTVKEGE